MNLERGLLNDLLTQLYSFWKKWVEESGYTIFNQNTSFLPIYKYEPLLIGTKSLGKLFLNQKCLKLEVEQGGELFVFCSLDSFFNVIETVFDRLNNDMEWVKWNNEKVVPLKREEVLELCA